MKIKQHFTKLLLLSAFFSSGIYANERTVEFSVPGNQYCDANHVTELSLVVSNLSDVETTIKLDLYTIKGTPLIHGGTANNGMESELTTGQELVLSGRATTTYHIPFGKGNVACSSRIYHGKITVSSLNGRVIASGFISGRNKELFRSSAPIIINGGNAF
ncbi:MULTISPECIES: hypothetical protein [unclassified Pseudoalteromonas]|uniref:hypothetical protein n=1 Tax=unclassified Pseudoalteromonas TaxID=194690 RepID=UPI00037CB60C|nr:MULTISPECIES: hypothetical protein [unclassified Pseudoalteromonas]RXE87980.1 hypothetical protein DRB05_04695 [Pseudoalteromonas sp. A757]